MAKATGIRRRKRRTSKMMPMIPTLTGSIFCHLRKGFKNLHQEGQTDRNGTKSDEISKGIKGDM
jgi:hypothetical protein